MKSPSRYGTTPMSLLILMTLRRSEVVVVGGFLYDTRDVRPFIPSSCKAVQSFHAHAAGTTSKHATYFGRGYSWYSQGVVM